MTYKNLNDLSEVITAKIMILLNDEHKIVSYPLSIAIEDIVYHHVQRYISDNNYIE